MKSIIILLNFCINASILAQNDSLFQKANSLFNEAKYEEAQNIYEQLLNNKEHSAELYFNLANAHYKLNHIAPSIYYYEKALLLKPNDKDILNNLSLANNMTIDAIQNVPKVGFAKLANNIVNLAVSDTWAIISVCGVLLFVLLFLWYHFAIASTKKRIAFVISLLSLFLAVFALIMAFQKSKLDKLNSPAIIFAQEIRVKSAPNKISEDVFILHEGTKVQIMEKFNDWFKIELSDNTIGWILSNDVRLIKT